MKRLPTPLFFQTAGTGPLYQGRFKSFPIQEDEHLLTVCRYVERNALRANLVGTAQAWPWCSLAFRAAGQGLLDAGPLPWPRNWLAHVNRPQTEKELEALRRCVLRGCPFGAPAWQEKTAKALGLEATLRNRGWPKKMPAQLP